MRKNILSLSIAAMIGSMGVAHANVIVPAAGLIPAGVAAADRLVVGAGGVGHALITPYFTTNGGNMTVLSVVNTDTVNGKAVKVRFRSAANSDDILDFQVYMSPSDHWSAAVTQNASGMSQIVTNDNTCTLPALVKGTNYPFVADRLPSYLTAAEKGAQTSEGYVEIFNMADIPADTSSTRTLYASILHSGGVPRDCSAAALTATLTDQTTEAGAVALGFKAPTTGLTGNWTIINVAQTTTFSDAMTSIRAVTNTLSAAANGTALQDGYGNYVLFPQNGNAATGVDAATADPLFRTNSNKTLSSAGVLGTGTDVVASPSIAAANYDLPDMSTPYVSSSLTPIGQAAVLTSALAVRSVTNEYSTDPTVNASTDWTFSMPTRRYSVAMLYGASAAAAVPLFTRVVSTRNALGQPFFHSGNVAKSGDRICVSADGQKFYDREEGGKSTGAVFSPGSVSVFQFCGEDSVTTFGSASVLGAKVATQSPSASTIFTSGWGVVNTNNGGIGLPVLGSAFIKLTNPAASAGTSGTYGINSAHRFAQ